MAAEMQNGRILCCKSSECSRGKKCYNEYVGTITPSTNQLTTFFTTPLGPISVVMHFRWDEFVTISSENDKNIFKKVGREELTKVCCNIAMQY